MGFVKDFFSGIYNLVVGLGVTGKHLGRHAITLQYPKERWPMPERSRGVVVLLTNLETGKLNCTACMLCMKACPSAAIKIEREKNENKRWEASVFNIDNTTCCFCGLCEEACNFDAIKLTGKYEMSVYDQDILQYDMAHLTELGIDVKYTPRPKKKPPVKKKVAPKPAVSETDKKETPVKASDAKAEPKVEKPTDDKKEPETKPDPKAEKPTDDKKAPEAKPETKAETKPVVDKEDKKDAEAEKKPQSELNIDKEDKKDSEN